MVILIKKINGIPLFAYLKCLNARGFNNDLVIKYTKNIYNIEISKEIDKNKNIMHFSDDTFITFYEMNPDYELNNNDRDYFNSKTKPLFNKFSKHAGIDKNFDFFCGNFVSQIIGCGFKVSETLKTDVIHHIHPLVYGGTNNFENLLCVSRFNHEILHENPKEDIEKYCFQAVDYLFYLWDQSSGAKELIDKYKLREIKREIGFDAYLSAIKNEMRLFYSRIK